MLQSPHTRFKGVGYFKLQMLLYSQFGCESLIRSAVVLTLFVGLKIPRLI